MTTTSDFKTGDRVKHVPADNVGTVTAVDHQGVHVSFDRPGMRGIYDDFWFRKNPGWLVKVSDDNQAQH